MSSVGGGAKAAATSTYAAIHLASGPLLEFIHLESETAASIRPSDVQKIAQTAAG